MTIALIGGGNMAQSLVGGLLRAGIPSGEIVVSDSNAQARSAVAALGVTAHADNHAAVRYADTLVLAVKPQVLAAVASEIRDVVRQQQPLVVSIAAGVGTRALLHWLGPVAVVRAMPNTPALVGAGITVLYSGKDVSAEQRRSAEMIMRAVGEVEWADDESLLDAVTAVSGSGPAYFFLVMEALEQAAVQVGLDPGLAHRLVCQTALGSALMARTDDPAVLRARVTSPGGTTERGVGVLEQQGLRTTFAAAITAAWARSRELLDLYR
jgi:pyrroline-5-carboxylate reductase